MHHLSVAGVVLDSRRHVLLVERRDTRDWQIPGGILEESESVEAGLTREILEETGLRVQPLKLTGLYKNVRLHSLAMVFLCVVEGGTLLGETDETVDARWFDVPSAVEACDGMFALRIIDAMSPDCSPVIRTHDGTVVLSTMFDSPGQPSGI